MLDLDADRPGLAVRLERFRAKWLPVRVKKTRQSKCLEPPFRFYRNGALAARRCDILRTQLTIR
ncbi:hypothetical protein BEL01nite_29290 [Bradyrhizobium elkanii]|nr:hypothetical protein BEL01nite_29290 [Bradyrhizobium elkanii]